MNISPTNLAWHFEKADLSAISYHIIITHQNSHVSCVILKIHILIRHAAQMFSSKNTHVNGDIFR